MDIFVWLGSKNVIIILTTKSDVIDKYLHLYYSSLNPKLSTCGCLVIIGNSDNVQTILEKMKGANIDVEDAKERTPLHGAVMYNNTDVVELLVDR